MARPCEICASLQALGHTPAAARGRRRMVLVEERIVALCGPHADAVLTSGADTLAAIYAGFVEPNGRRSLLGRRAPLDRRVFPPRPEGRRLGTGRRAIDVQ